MSIERDWLPSNHEERYETIERLFTYITRPANRERMDFGATTKTGIWFTEEYAPKLTDYFEAYRDWQDPAQRTATKQRTLEVQEKIIEPLTRTLYNFFLTNNYFVTDTDLAAMMLPKRPDGHPTPAPVAKQAPWIQVVLTKIAHVVIHFRGSETKKAKLKGQHGVECRYVISDRPVVDYEELVHSVFATRSPLELPFAGHERGKTVYFAVRWENTRGEKGDFSDIFDVMIP